MEEGRGIESEGREGYIEQSYNITAERLRGDATERGSEAILSEGGGAKMCHLFCYGDNNVQRYRPFTQEDDVYRRAFLNRSFLFETFSGTF